MFPPGSQGPFKGKELFGKGDKLNDAIRRATHDALCRITGASPIQVNNGPTGAVVSLAGGYQVKTAITCRDNSNWYPPEPDDPDTYAFKLTRISYTAQPGHQGHSTTYIYSSTKYDGYVHNLYDGDEDKYLPEGTEIFLWFDAGNGQYLTWSCCKFTHSSSSISVSVSSLSSSSLSSKSSSSKSSVSSSSSRSSASSASSQSSSKSSLSSASSLSSSSASSQSASSQSSASSSSRSSVSSASSVSASSASSSSSASSVSVSSSSSGSSLSSSSASSGSSSSSSSLSSSSSSSLSSSSASSASSSSASSLSSSSASSLSSLSSQSHSTSSSASSQSSSSASSQSASSASSQSASSASSQSQSSQSASSQSSQSVSSASSASSKSTQSSQSCSGLLKPWHRFELIDKLDTKVGSVAEAWALIWNQANEDWERSGEIVSVHNYNGRHFGLPGEKGWARCEGDSNKPEVVSLGGLMRFGTLDENLVAGQSAQFSICNDTDGGAGPPQPSGYTLTVYDYLLPAGAQLSYPAKVWVKFDEISEKWFVTDWTRGPLLGKPASSITNGNVGVVNVYAGAQNAEVASGQEVQALCRLHGIARANEWVWLDSPDGGVSWEITEAVGGDLIYGKVTTSGATLSATFPGNAATVNIYKNGTNTGVQIQAAVVHAPILDSEGVHCLWTGEQFSIVAGDFDGGIVGTYTGTGTNAILPKGSSSTSFKVAPGPGADPTTAISFSVTAHRGFVLANTQLWLTRNANRFYVGDGYIETVYGKVDNTYFNPPDDSTPPVQAKINAIGAAVTLHVYQDTGSGYADTGATISAKVRHAPVFDSEFVSASWEGLQLIIVSGDYDGGINGKYTGFSQLAKGGSSSFFTVQMHPSTTPGGTTGINESSITCQLGSIDSNKLVRISRDKTGVYATSAEC